MADTIFSVSAWHGKVIVRPDGATLRDLYEVQRLGSHVLAKRFGVTPTTIVRWLKKDGIAVRPTLSLEKKGMLKPTEAVLRDLYEVQRLATREIAKRLGVSHISVNRWLREFRIEVRPGGGLAYRGIKPPSRDDLHRMLNEEHIGYRGVAEQYNVDPTAVGHWVKRYGINPPTIWQTRSKGRQPTLDPEEVRSLYESGYSMAQIGALFGITEQPVRTLFEKHGFEARAAGLMGQRYFCSNGLEVRSSYEIRVAEWLISRGINFIYEPHYPFGGRMTADFGANGWFIEVWGIEGDEQYNRQKRRKIRLCEAHGLALIQLNSDDFGVRRCHILMERLSKVLAAAPQTAVQGMLF